MKKNILKYLTIISFLIIPIPIDKLKLPVVLNLVLSFFSFITTMFFEKFQINTLSHLFQIILGLFGSILYLSRKKTHSHIGLFCILFWMLITAQKSFFLYTPFIIFTVIFLIFVVINFVNILKKNEG